MSRFPPTWLILLQLFFAESAAEGQFSMVDLHIQPGSRAAALFSEVDANSDGKMNSSELEDLSLRLEGPTILQNAEQPDLEVVLLFSGKNCTGNSITVPRNASEALCKNCFDACQKSFDSNLTDQDLASAVLQAQSLRVLHGQVRITTSNCHGTVYRGDKSQEPAVVITTLDECSNFEPHQMPRHLELQDTALAANGASLYFSFQREDSQGLLAAAAVPDIPSDIFQEIDSSGDGKLSKAEYAAFINQFHDMPDKESELGAGQKGFEDMARTSLLEKALLATNPTLADVQAEATRLFGEEYEYAKLISDRSRPGDSSSSEGHQVVDMGGSNVWLCADGLLAHLGQCYKACNFEYPVGRFGRCYKPCPANTTDIGYWCVENLFKWHKREGYWRGMGQQPKKCPVRGSFGPGALSASPLTRFTAAVVSDTQLPWCSGKTKSDKECAIEENSQMVRAANLLSPTLHWPGGKTGSTEQVRPLTGVFLNGDLTAYGHLWQVDLFRKMWETQSDVSADQNLKIPIWLGFGNHDVGNNVGGCHAAWKEPMWLGYTDDGCAQRMLGLLRTAAAGCGRHTVMPAFGGRVDHFDLQSAAYTVSFGKLRAVMLHNYPSFDAEGELTNFASAMSFMEKEFAYANKVGAYMMLFIHDLGDHFKEDLKDEHFKKFADLLNTSRVVSIFCGHWHSRTGNDRGNLTSYDTSNGKTKAETRKKVTNVWGDQIPVLRSGAADKLRFLALEYNEDACEWRFGAVSARGGNPSWFYPGNGRYHNRYHLRDCTSKGGGGPQCKIGHCDVDGCPGCSGQEYCTSGRCVKWGPWISEESGTSGDYPFAASGVACEGKYCDKVRLRQESAAVTSLMADWSEWASDTTDTQISKCTDGHAVAQIACGGEYCANVRVRCGALSNMETKTKKSDWFSEEDPGEATCPDGYVVTALECQKRTCVFGFLNCGNYCDNKRLHCTKVGSLKNAQASTGDSSGDGQDDGNEGESLWKYQRVVSGTHGLHPWRLCSFGSLALTALIMCMALF